MLRGTAVQYWNTGVLDWSIVLDYCTGTLYWSAAVLEHSSTAVLEFLEYCSGVLCCTGVEYCIEKMEYWSTAVLQYWSIVLVYCSGVVME